MKTWKREGEKEDGPAGVKLGQTTLRIWSRLCHICTYLYARRSKQYVRARPILAVPQRYLSGNTARYLEAKKNVAPVWILLDSYLSFLPYHGGKGQIPGCHLANTSMMLVGCVDGAPGTRRGRPWLILPPRSPSDLFSVGTAGRRSEI